MRIPPYLKATHPDEMTIVLQFKFDDLAVNDDGFSVSLSFKGKRENLHVPWTAVTSFADPSVNFGLQFKIALQGAGEVEASAAVKTAAGVKRKRPGARRPKPSPTAAKSSPRLVSQK